MALLGREREQRAQQWSVVRPGETVLVEDLLEPAEPLLDGAFLGDEDSPRQEMDDGRQRRILGERRAMDDQPGRIALDLLGQGPDQARLADPGLAGDQHRLSRSRARQAE